MGHLGEFSTTVRLFLRAYRWRRIDRTLHARLRRPLASARVALISSAGFVLPEQEPFDEDRRGGDPTFRQIPSDTQVSRLVDTHRSETFDHTAMCLDPNLAFPLDRMRELVERGRIGELSSHALSFMGSITAPGRLTRTTAPEAARGLVEDGVDAALLVPV